MNSLNLAATFSIPKLFGVSLRVPNMEPPIPTHPRTSDHCISLASPLTRPENPSCIPIIL
ncbi:unnamed protein product [Schistosoma mattheei]|uniref:Uncharacterized protein n=1 Tax=Schistosoma mattheei TaxID=31246 RepID=A0A3P8EK08_9TREM|nr:unnamed protein product [Schistosoma mattheei]